ncbi:MAG: carboxy-terminal-processing protease, carboxyl-terminal processing protease [Candidatus Parcubacteria bacterium]
MKPRIIIGSLVLLGLGFFVGRQSVLPSQLVSGVYNTENASTTENVDFQPFWDAWNTINERYEGTDPVDAQTKVWGAIQGLADSLGDPYTVFLPPEDNEAFGELIGGSFGGVGMEIGKEDDVLVVMAPLKGTPAERAGVRAGDMIVEIGTTTTNGLSVDEAVDLIRGEPGTSISITFFREGETEPRELTIVREKIIVPTLDTELRADGIFVISLYNFDAHATADFRKAIKEFSETRSDKLIIDVRGNPGGYLDAAVSIASYFLPEGEVIVRESVDGAEETVYRSKGYARASKPLKMVVLVDGGSASASEILAGALQENNIAKLVGSQTFGKGSVQELIPITGDTSLKLTIAQWLTPGGTSISKEGLTPDIVVERTAEDFEADKDPQLDAAVADILAR